MKSSFPLFLAFLGILFLTAVSCGTSGRSATDSQEVVNIGYGVTDKDDLTYSVSTVKTNENEFYTNMYDYLRGKVAGVHVGPDNSITIRGITSINSSTEPLIIVDGAEVNSLDVVNPHDVYSVDVLKDASSSIYGVRGANGVIIITTKMGQSAKEEAAAAKKKAREEARAARKARK